MCLWDWEQPTICLVLFLPNNISNTLSRGQEVVPKVGVLYLEGARHGKSKILPEVCRGLPENQPLGKGDEETSWKP